jgi:hypothetical protein
LHGLIGASGNEQHPFVVEVVGTVIWRPLHVKKTLSWMLDHVAQMSPRGSVKAIHSLSSSIAALLSFRPSIREFFGPCPQAFKFDLCGLFSVLFQSLDSSVVSRKRHSDFGFQICSLTTVTRLTDSLRLGKN